MRSVGSYAMTVVEEERIARPVRRDRIPSGSVEFPAPAEVGGRVISKMRSRGGLG
jgi:hypothetical protein